MSGNCIKGTLTDSHVFSLYGSEHLGVNMVHAFPDGIMTELGMSSAYSMDENAKMEGTMDTNKIDITIAGRSTNQEIEFHIHFTTDSGVNLPAV